MQEDSESDTYRIDPGETVYDDDGQPLGHVTSRTDDRFEVNMRGRNTPQGVGHEELPGQEFGEGYLMWRCGECGEMGHLEDGIPPTCPTCGAPEEALSEVRED
jgi:rubrerythrin